MYQNHQKRLIIINITTAKDALQGPIADFPTESDVTDGRRVAAGVSSFGVGAEDVGVPVAVASLAADPLGVVATDGTTVALSVSTVGVDEGLNVLF